MKFIWAVFLSSVLLLWSSEAQAGQLAERLAQFPDWDKPSVSTAENDLVYPDWMEGTWNVTSTLVEQVAPLAPKLVTPGFESNRRYLNQPVSFLVRFQAVNDSSLVKRDRILPFLSLTTKHSTHAVVADRAFNGLNISKAYLGDRIIRVLVDPNSPNHQITTLRNGNQLTSTVTGRATETPSSDQFIATEVSNQVFRGTNQPYFNEVETTTAYQLQHSLSLAIEALQVTAIYLSPQDPDYFKAQGRPVALYRYHLELVPITPT